MYCLWVCRSYLHLVKWGSKGQCLRDLYLPVRAKRGPRIFYPNLTKRVVTEPRPHPAVIPFLMSVMSEPKTVLSSDFVSCNSCYYGYSLCTMVTRVVFRCCHVNLQPQTRTRETRIWFNFPKLNIPGNWLPSGTDFPPISKIVKPKKWNGFSWSLVHVSVNYCATCILKSCYLSWMFLNVYVFFPSICFHRFVLLTNLKKVIKLLVTQSFFLFWSPVTPYSPYWILTTDYTSFSVVYSCTDILRIFHVDYAWILSRSRFLPYETVQYAKELLYKEGIDVFRMKATNQIGCKDD